MFNQFLGEEGSKRVSKWAAISLVLLSAFLLVRVISDLKKLPNAGREVYPQSTIMVTGTGEAFAIPDIANFSFSIVERGKTVKEAQEKADAKTNKALATVREAGVADKDIQTTNYSVYPKYEYSNAVCPQSSVGINSVPVYCPPGKQTLTGYEVNQTITVKIRNTESAGDLVTKVGAAGVSNISGIQFSVDDRDKYLAQAREQAITKAKAKAKVLSKQLGVRLGDILYYNDSSDQPYEYAYGKGGSDMSVAQAAPRAAELPTGETKITANISITYEIK